MSKESQNLVKRTPVIRERTLVPSPRKRTPSNKHKKKLDNLSSKILKLEQELKVTKKIHLCDKKGCKLATATFGEK